MTEIQVQTIRSAGWKGTCNFIWAVWWIQENKKGNESWKELLAVFEAEALRFVCLSNNPHAKNPLMEEYRASLRSGK